MTFPITWHFDSLFWICQVKFSVVYCCRIDHVVTLYNLPTQAIMTYDSREIEKGYSILAKGLELTDSKRQKRTDYLRMKAPTYEEVTTF